VAPHPSDAAGSGRPGRPHLPGRVPLHADLHGVRERLHPAGQPGAPRPGTPGGALPRLRRRAGRPGTAQAGGAPLAGRAGGPGRSRLAPRVGRRAHDQRRTCS
jgi:hypothetical protein